MQLRLPLFLLPVAVLWTGASGGTNHWSDLQALEKRVAIEPKTDGYWKQVAVIESFRCESGAASGIGPTVPPAKPGNYNLVSFLTNNQFVVVDGEHAIRVFGIDDGKLIRSFGSPEPDSWQQRSLIVSSDGRFITIIPDSQPTIWDTQTGKAVGKLPKFADQYTAATFFSDGRKLATYRGAIARGDVPGNLQIWLLDEKAQNFSLERSIDADKDARGLQEVGPYLILRNYRRSQVFDASSFNVVLKQDGLTDEEFLFVDTPTNNQAGRFASVQLSNGKGDWRGQKPQFRLLKIPGGNEEQKWNCPIEENEWNDHRYQARFAISPKRSVVAISQEGHVNFFRFLDGTKINSLVSSNKYEHPAVSFVDEQYVRYGQKIIDIASGKKIASFPENGIVASDGKYMIAQRWMVPLDTNSNIFVMLPHPLVVVWRKN
ncbi:MAG: hypothetical protein WCK57_00895 [Verrucomicrobiae bacterium]